MAGIVALIWAGQRRLIDFPFGSVPLAAGGGAIVYGITRFLAKITD